MKTDTIIFISLTMPCGIYPADYLDIFKKNFAALSMIIVFLENHTQLFSPFLCFQI